MIAPLEPPIFPVLSIVPEFVITTPVVAAQPPGIIMHIPSCVDRFICSSGPEIVPEFEIVIFATPSALIVLTPDVEIVPSLLIVTSDASEFAFIASCLVETDPELLTLTVLLLPL